jgi:predicted RNA binding protein YcfA (HicA-like mRNA interferase family)
MSKPITYGQMEDALLAMGFIKHEVPGDHVDFTHPASNVMILLPIYDRSKPLNRIHRGTVPANLADFGFVEREQFEEVMRNRGRVAS